MDVLPKFDGDRGSSFMPRAWWNKLINYVLGTLVAGPGIQIYKQDSNTCIALSPSQTQSKLTIAKVTGYASYNGGTNNKLKVKKTDYLGNTTGSTEEEIYVWVKGTTLGVITNDSVTGYAAVGDLIIMEYLPILLGGAAAADGKFDAWAYRPGSSSSSTVPVLVKKTGGQAGSATVQCTWSYDIYKFVSNPQVADRLATGLIPKKKRNAIGIYDFALDFTEGLAMIDTRVSSNPPWILLEAYDERPQLGACTC